MIYKHFANPADWENEKHITVEVDPDGQAYVRSRGKTDAPAYRIPVPEALKRAETIVMFGPWHTGFGVRLKEGACWDDSWGRLIDANINSSALIAAGEDED